MQNRDRFDKFTERARKVLQLAQEEAQRLHNNYIGIEHLWLGIMREGEGVGAKVLEGQGVTLQNMRDAVVTMQGSSKQTSQGHLGLTEAGKKAVEQAVNEALRLNHHYIGTEHLLLGLVHQADKTTQEIFDTLGVKLENLSDQTMKILTQAGATQQGTSVPRTVSSPQEQDRFKRFSTLSMKVLAFAQEEAQHFQHNYIGTEHLLLGLLRQTDGLASEVLNSLGVELNKVRSALEFIIGRGDRIVLGEIGLTPRAKRLIDLAIQEADLLESEAIETEHLLLGLIREGEGIAIGILESLGVNRAKVYIRTLHRLDRHISQRATLFLSSKPDSGSGQGQPGQPSKESMPAPTEEDKATTTGIIQRLSNQRYSADRLNEEAKSVLTFASQEAGRFQHNYIGTEHLLLGLTRLDASIAARALTQMGIELAKVRGSVEFIIGRGDHPVLGQIGLTPRAREVIELAADEARLLQNDYIGAEHLLLGLVREGEGIAAGILESLGVELPAVRTQVIQQIERDQQKP